MTTPKERAAKAFEYALGYYNMHDDAPTLVEIEEAADKVLAAIAEPSDAMIEAIKSAWKTPHASISDNGAIVIWKTMHAAMMAEREPKIYKTTIAGIGPWCVEFDDGEIITTRTEERAKLIAGVK